MIIFLALVLIILMILIGGERGAVSLMTLAGNIVILFISILLMSIGFPALLLILAAGAGVCYNSLFYQNGNNPKTRAAFLATLLVMLLLFIIFLSLFSSVFLASMCATSWELFCIMQQVVGAICIKIGMKISIKI